MQQAMQISVHDMFTLVEKNISGFTMLSNCFMTGTSVIIVVKMSIVIPLNFFPCIVKHYSGVRVIFARFVQIPIGSHIESDQKQNAIHYTRHA